MELRGAVLLAAVGCGLAGLVVGLMLADLGPQLIGPWGALWVGNLLAMLGGGLTLMVELRCGPRAWLPFVAAAALIGRAVIGGAASRGLWLLVGWAVWGAWAGSVYAGAERWARVAARLDEAWRYCFVSGPRIGPRSGTGVIGTTLLTAGLSALASQPFILLQALREPVLVGWPEWIWESSLLALLGGSLALTREFLDGWAGCCLGCLSLPLCGFFLLALGIFLQSPLTQVTQIWLAWLPVAALGYLGWRSRIARRMAIQARSHGEPPADAADAVDPV